MIILEGTFIYTVLIVVFSLTIAGVQVCVSQASHLLFVHVQQEYFLARPVVGCLMTHPWSALQTVSISL